MKGIMKIVSFLVSKVPTTNVVTFNSCPDYTDNAFAIFWYLSKNNYGMRYKFVWLINQRDLVNSIRNRIKKEGYHAVVVYKMSYKGLWYYLRSRYCFFTHGILENIPLKQHPDKMINLWHGMPIKKLGAIDDGKYMRNQNCMIASSFMFQKIMAECFCFDENKILPIGLPRCDLLFEKTDFFAKQGVDLSKYNKVGIWLPTYRYSIAKTEKRIDGTYKPGAISFLDETLLNKLNVYLCQVRQLLIIKLHPMDKSQLYQFDTYTNIIIIKQDNFDSQLYPLIGSCDYLLTDYSSVAIDFDICKKPMGFVIDDYESYKDSRGFVFDDLASVLPGPIIRNYDELVKFISNPFYKPSSCELNRFYDRNASKRLVDYLNM